MNSNKQRGLGGGRLAPGQLLWTFWRFQCLLTSLLLPEYKPTSVVTVQGEYALNKRKESFGPSIIGLITLPPQIRTPFPSLTFSSYCYHCFYCRFCYIYSLSQNDSTGLQCCFPENSSALVMGCSDVLGLDSTCSASTTFSGSTCDPCVFPSSQPLLLLQLSFSLLICPLGLWWKSPPHKWMCAAETELYSQSRSVAFGRKGLSQMTLPSSPSGLMLFSMSLTVGLYLRRDCLLN